MFEIKKSISKLLIILIIGGIGGIAADQFFLPYLASIPAFSKIEFVQRTINGTTIINPTEKIIITENIAVEQAINKIGPSLVSVHAYKNKKLISQGTGLIITSDGLILTAANLVSSEADQYLIFRNGHSLIAEIDKVDIENNLALLKIEETNLTVASFTDLDNLQLGERAILTGAELNKEKVSHFVNLGIIRSINDGEIKINIIQESGLANGSPLINIKGETIGLNLVDENGFIKIISVDVVKEFVGL